jgi:uncharacterized protein YndB with AHSA1/START domain
VTVTNIEKDYDKLTLLVTADFDAPVERVWQLWADPRKLERWWGPPTHPATVEEHDLAPGGAVSYYLTDPGGAKFRGWWRIRSVEPPRALEFEDGFANDDGTPVSTTAVTTNRVTLTEHSGGTRMELRVNFASREHFDRLEAMGGVEGMQASIAQMDALLTETEGNAR